MNNAAFTAQTYSGIDMRYFSNMIPRCANDESPGVVETRLAYMDWSVEETTPDQRRVENVLAGFVNSGSRVLHVGMGNSRLAVRFAPLVEEIVGMTVTPSELQLAQSLAIGNYRPLLWNKYCEWHDEGAKFDAIVDNNPSTYACCFHHMMKMFAWYVSSLDQEGAILTDVAGLGHEIPGDGRFGQYELNYTALKEVGIFFGLHAVDVDGSVYLLTRSPDSERIKALRKGLGTSRFFNGVHGYLRHARRKIARLVR